MVKPVKPHTHTHYEHTAPHQLQDLCPPELSSEQERRRRERRQHRGCPVVPEVVVLRPDHAPRRRRCRRLPLRLRLRPRRRLRLRGGGRRHRGVLGDRPERRLPRRPRRPPPPLLRGRRHRRRLLLRRLIHRRRRQPPAAPHEGEQLHPRA